MIAGPEMSIPRTPTHSADLHKDSIVHNIDDMDTNEEKKGIIVTIFVIVCMVIIVSIGVVALILKGEILIYCQKHNSTTTQLNQRKQNNQQINKSWVLHD